MKSRKSDTRTLTDGKFIVAHGELPQETKATSSRFLVVGFTCTKGPPESPAQKVNLINLIKYMQIDKYKINKFKIDIKNKICFTSTGIR